MKELLNNVYFRLVNKSGNMHWWPGETRDEIIIGAILTQNVSWKNVAKALENLKSKNMLTLKAVHEASAMEVGTLIQPTRFYNQKVISIKNFTKYLFDNYSGELDTMFASELENLRTELLNIKGLGAETVDCILLYGGNKLIFVIDGYTTRVFSRLGVGEKNWAYDDYQRLFMSNINPDLELYKDYHAQIVNLGHSLCKNKKPNCRVCPLAEICENGK